MEIINALLIEPGKPPYLVLLENRPECIQGILGGRLSVARPWNDTVIALFTRQAEAGGQPNRMLLNDKNGSAIARVFGSLLLCNTVQNIEKGSPLQFASMTKEQALKYAFRFQIPDIIERDRNGMMHWKVFYQKIEGLSESEE